MGIFEVKPFKVYANNQEEADEMRKAFIDFINYHGSRGRVVSAFKVTKAIREWDKNPIVKNQIINYFNNGN